MANKKSPPNPTNRDIWERLGGMGEQLDAIHKQAKATNGRVTRLEQWKTGLDIIEVYKRDHPVETRVQTTEEIKSQESGWTNRERFLTSVILALLAIMGALVGTGKL